MGRPGARGAGMSGGWQVRPPAARAAVRLGSRGQKQGRWAWWWRSLVIWREPGQRNTEEKSPDSSRWEWDVTLAHQGQLASFQESWSHLGGSDSKESACNAGDPGSVPGSGTSPGEGNGNPPKYSCLENSMDRGAWQAQEMMP